MNLRLPFERLLLPAFLPLVLAIFTVSGFAGLIYESIWSHYLKLFLGHAAYAQTVVLAIFMGGMALGAWLASRISQRWRNLLLAYAVVESLVGIASLVFHEVFVAVTAFAFDTAIPALGAPGSIHAFKWTVAALLILPQSTLLGMTFPLLTAGVLRARPDRQGYAIAMLYFANSLGAAVGVLASGFYFIPAVGLPGTLLAAAVLNLAVAAAAALLPCKEAAASAAAARAPTYAGGSSNLARTLLLVAALTGMSSFMYEIGWIRMLALVLGSSTHAFELMLSAFILGLAFGGLWVRRRMDASKDSIRFLAIVQLAMGLAALATLPIYGSTFGLMQWTLGTLQQTDSGYAAFNALSHAICLAVMFPAAFCAGMTLPLITVSLLRHGAGERAIGQVYAANTVGAIVGVAAAVHLGLPLLGVKGLILAGAAVDLALGIVLLGGLRSHESRRFIAAGFAGCVIVLAGTAWLVELDAHKMASGVFRKGGLLDPKEDVILFQEDGKTATVSVTGLPGGGKTLRTNGKPDGSARDQPSDPARLDEVTQVLVGALPLYYAPDARRVASIGLGTGISAHVILASPTLEVLDTVEIEREMVRAASHFTPLNRRALDDPRSRIHFEDAKTFFSAAGARYDVIISEPSNPWVSGVASLFTTEFYRDIRRYLNEGGIFVQWVQVYETSPVLVASVIAALRPHFSDYAVWAANDGDVIIVAKPEGRLPVPDLKIFGYARLAEELSSIGIRAPHELSLHWLGSRATLDPYFAAFGAPANSDFQPYLDIHAAKARFKGESARAIFRLQDLPVPVLALLEGRPAASTDLTRFSDSRWSARPSLARQAFALDAYVRSGDTEALLALPGPMQGEAVVLRHAVQRCRFDVPGAVLRWTWLDAARLVNNHLPPAHAQAFWAALAKPACLAGLESAERRWLGLHAALAQGDPALIASAALAVLEADPDLSDRLRAYALASYMAARIREGRPQEALRAYAPNRRKLKGAAEWQPAFQLLLGHIDYGGAQ